MKKVELEVELNEMRNENFSLERQVAFLLSELVSLNEGIGVKPEWFKNETTWDKCMAHKAGIAIKKLHEMRR